MNATTELLHNNEAYAGTFAHGGLAAAPRLKVAVLTALHLAQEYHELKKNCDSRAMQLSRTLEQVLKL